MANLLEIVEQICRKHGLGDDEERYTDWSLSRIALDGDAVAYRATRDIDGTSWSEDYHYIEDVVVVVINGVTQLVADLIDGNCSRVEGDWSALGKQNQRLINGRFPSVYERLWSQACTAAWAAKAAKAAADKAARTAEARARLAAIEC